MTPDRARALIGHWPKDAEYMAAERWSIMGDFWKAVEDTRRVWAAEWDLTLDQAKTVLAINNEEGEKTQWNKSQVASVASRQRRLY